MADLTLRQYSTDSGGLQSTAYDRSIRDIGNSKHAEVVVGKVTTSSAGPVSCPASGNTALLTVSTLDLERIFVQFSVATQALDAFIIQGRCSADATLTNLYSAAADYTAPTGLLVGASGDLTTTAAGSSGWFIMDVRGLYEVKVLASGAVDSAAVTIYMGGQ